MCYQLLVPDCRWGHTPPPCRFAATRLLLGCRLRLGSAAAAPCACGPAHLALGGVAATAGLEIGPLLGRGEASDWATRCSRPFSILTMACSLAWLNCGRFTAHFSMAGSIICKMQKVVGRKEARLHKIALSPRKNIENKLAGLTYIIGIYSFAVIHKNTAHFVSRRTASRNLIH